MQEYGTQSPNYTFQVQQLHQGTKECQGTKKSLNNCKVSKLLQSFIKPLQVPFLTNYIIENVKCQQRLGWEFSLFKLLSSWGNDMGMFAKKLFLLRILW